MEKTVDGVTEGEVRSESGIIVLFQQHVGGFAVLLPVETPSGVIAGCRDILARPDSGKHTPELRSRGIIPGPAL